MVATTSSNGLALNTTYFKDILLVQLPPRLSVIEAIPFRNTFQTWVQQDSLPRKIILDFSQTSLIDSSGIGSLLSNFKVAKAQDIQLILWSLSPQVNLALSLAGLDRILTIDANTEAAIPVDTRNQAQPLSFRHPSVRSPLKRTIDITVALIGLSITGLLFVPIAIALTLDSPGPLFVRQQRCGLMGRRFYMWQFRTMAAQPEVLHAVVVHEPAHGHHNHIGRFLRKTSLDRLPQFWNVLKGEMSFIGPCPPTPDEIEQYEVISWQSLDVKPGLIGVGKLHGQSKTDQVEEAMHLDLRYQENWSVLYDIKLFFNRCFQFFKNDSGAV
jgi:anti-anti-sigma factor